MEFALARRQGIRVLLGWLALAVAVLALACTDGEGEPETPQAPGAAAPAAAVVMPASTDTPEPTPTATPPPLPATPIPPPEERGAGEQPVSALPADGLVRTLEQLVEHFGEPQDADFARLRIPVLGVDAPVGEYLVDGRVMPAPDNPVEVAWYDMGLFPGTGGRPGEGGNAIFAGHVDYFANLAYAGTRYRGPGIFYDLATLRPGHVIEVIYEGELLRYEVEWVEHIPATRQDWSDIWSADVEEDSITLYTCGGSFDRDSRSYSDRIVVRATRAD